MHSKLKVERRDLTLFGASRFYSVFPLTMRVFTVVIVEQGS